MSRRAADLWIGLTLCALIVVLLVPFASERPDTLERTAEKLGNGAGTGPAGPGTVPAPLNDYRLPGVRTPGVSRVLAGLAGILAVVLVARLALVRRRPVPASPAAAGTRAPGDPRARP